MLAKTSAFRKSQNRGMKLTHSNLCFPKKPRQRNQACSSKPLLSEKAKTEELSLLAQTSAFRKSQDRGIMFTPPNLCFSKKPRQRNQACSLKPLLSEKAKTEESSLLLQTSAFRISQDRGIKLTRSNLCFPKKPRQRNQVCSLKPLLFE